MADISAAVQMLPKIVDIAMKIALFFVALFFGRIAFAGWRVKTDFITKTIGTIVLGFLCFAIGIILPLDLFPQISFVSEAINSLISAGIFFVILFLLSPREHPEFLKRKDIVTIVKDIDFLKEEISRINKAMIDKGIQAKALTLKEITDKVNEIFKQKKIQKFSIGKSELKDNRWIIEAKAKGRDYILQFSAFSGDLVSFRKTGFDFKDIIERLSEDKLALVGAVVLILFLFVIFSSLTPSNLAKVSERFSFYGVELPSKPGECMKVTELLNTWNNNEASRTTYSFDNELVASNIRDYLNESVGVSVFLYEYQIAIRQNNSYVGAFFATGEKISSMTDSLNTLQASMITGGAEICSVSGSGKVCDCKSTQEVSPQLTTLLNIMSSELS